jgi:hypothetical protein
MKKHEFYDISKFNHITLRAVAMKPIPVGRRTPQHNVGGDAWWMPSVDKI